MTDNEPTVEAKADTYHNPAVLDSISSQAKIASWIILGVGIAILLFNLYNGFQQISQFGVLEVLISLLNSFVLPLVCAFFYVLLRATSEGIYVLMDIEENTRRSDK